MERVLVSRQPIYRADRTELGYELLFRDSDEDRAFFADGDQATAEVIVNALMEIGLDEIVGEYPAFINFDRNLILGNYCQFLPKERVVLEVLETIKPDAPLVKKLSELRDLHYRIALDDFVCNESLFPLLELANFVKFDLKVTDWASLEKSVDVVRKYPVELIAEKVETQEEFERCKALGFNYYQGYFFSRPQLIEGRRPPVNRSAAVGLIIKLNNPNLDLKELEDAISQDVSLSYKLLRYINSASFSLRREVGTIGHAIKMLGNEKIRTWASLILFSSFVDKLRDIVITGTVRARMCEHLCNSMKIDKPQRAFLVGLLSVLDTILERPMEEVIKPLPLDKDIVDALLYQKGQLGSVLRCVLEYEKRNWREAQAAVSLTEDVIDQAYRQSMNWSLTTLNGVSAAKTS
jgi:EAL and modified HD-GYP domain-containing signal transduction protein